MHCSFKKSLPVTQNDPNIYLYCDIVCKNVCDEGCMLLSHVTKKSIRLQIAKPFDNVSNHGFRFTNEKRCHSVQFTN
jgi:hypothetical protein